MKTCKPSNNPRRKLVRPPRRSPEGQAGAAGQPCCFGGIDYHRQYSVIHVVDTAGRDLLAGRVTGHTAEAYHAFFARLPGPCSVVFKSSGTWQRLYDLLEDLPQVCRITMANPYKTRVIAEAQVKTDKVDARILAQLLRADLICPCHISLPEARRRKELLRQRTFLVRLRESAQSGAPAAGMPEAGEAARSQKLVWPPGIGGA